MGLSVQFEVCRGGTPRAKRPSVSAGPKLVEPSRQDHTDTPVTIVEFPSPDDALLDFAPEASLNGAPRADASAQRAVPLSRGVRVALPLVITLLVLASLGVGVFWFNQRPSAATTGSLSIQSEPAGAEVTIDGTVRGTTPLAIELASGDHAVTVTGRDGRREMTVAITAGQQAVHHITWAAASTPAVPTAATGGLSVDTNPPGDVVLVDGAERGRTPLRLSGLAAGSHVVTVRSGGTTHRRSIDVAAGVTTSLVISTTPGSGWLSVPTPVPMQVREGDQVVGTTEVSRIMLAPGDHNLEFVADSVGFSTRRTVRIAAGQGTTLDLPLPRAGVNINAVPWAEVFVDGQRVGETPLANVQITLGPHEIVFRHPELGERRVQTVAKLGETGRVSVDMRK